MGDWINRAGVLQRGKYRGDTIDNVANDDEDYCHWLLETVDLTREEESMIEEALGL